MIETYAIPALIAGFLTFFAPCTLPLTPAYLMLIGGTTMHDLLDSDQRRAIRGRVLRNSFFFIMGFSLVFVIFGLAAGSFGKTLIAHRILLSQIGGVFIALFGLFMLNLIPLPALFKEFRFSAPAFFAVGHPINALIFGLTFGFGWSPCIGPTLGTILTLAATGTTAISGAILLLIFSLGLAIPFFLLAIFIGSAARVVKKLSLFARPLSIAGGIFFLFLGFLLIFNRYGFWSNLVLNIFDFIPQDRLLNYL